MIVSTASANVSGFLVGGFFPVIASCRRVVPSIPPIKFPKEPTVDANPSRIDAAPIPVSCASSAIADLTSGELKNSESLSSVLDIIKSWW